MNSDSHTTGEVADSFTAYAEKCDNPRFTSWLRKQAEPAWTEATNHQMTQELGAGILEEAVMAQYLVQDYVFLDTLVGVFGYAVGQAPTMTEKRQFVEFLDLVTDDENDYFERSFEALGISERHRDDPVRTETTESFIDFLELAKQQGGYAETLAVLVPAEWVYLSWATRESENPPEAFYFTEWIDLHANERFNTFVMWLREQLDTVGPTLSSRRQRRVARLFERTVTHEIAFFDDAYDSAESLIGVS
ncbi:TenA family protein [Haloquadratum walsbyi]|uniref:Putative transcription activator n=1 Tax=Haloquadratum walsbyi J07HQW2 TaxID=1238425 RepID=U1NC14_9EURY|nr:TenA family protein [Haloquadratum walsbyi]ERG94430.1 MAG: putative transcription activator [Haloquadratum walsbyi J07HQW2]